MSQFWIVLLVGVAAIYIVTALFYECLCFISRFLSGRVVRSKRLMLIMMSGIFVAHALSILIYALIYWGLVHYGGFSELSGNIQEHFPTYLYFSITTYSSLGIGDVYPSDALRFLTGIEAINGLILITWSAAFTYFSVEKMWEAHGMEMTFCKKCNSTKKQGKNNDRS